MTLNLLDDTYNNFQNFNCIIIIQHLSKEKIIKKVTVSVSIYIKARLHGKYFFQKYFSEIFIKCFKTFRNVYMKCAWNSKLWSVENPVQQWIAERKQLSVCYCNLGLNTYMKCGQKVHFRERPKSDYFRSATSDRDNKWFFVLGLGTRFLLTLLLVSSQGLS